VCVCVCVCMCVHSYMCAHIGAEGIPSPASSVWWLALFKTDVG